MPEATPASKLTRRKHVLLHTWRLLAILAFGWLVFRQTNQPMGHISLTDAQKLYPSAASLRPQPGGSSQALDATGKLLGTVVATLPVARPVRGYRGPAQVLVAQDEAGNVTAWTLLHSPDTPEHVQQVLASTEFSKSLVGWHPSKPAPLTIDGVSGATLTSQAISAGIHQRLRQTGSVASEAASVKFPEPVGLLEARRLFPKAASMRKVGPRYQILDSTGIALGWCQTTGIAAEGISGYQGPTECLVAISPDEKTVLAVRLRRSYDNAEYVDRIRKDEAFLASFSNRPVSEIAQLDLATEEVQGVSGATLTSFALTSGLRSTLGPPAAAAPLARATTDQPWRWQDGVLALLAIGGLILSLSKSRGSPWLRWAWQAVIMAVVGAWLGGLLSLHYLAGWAEHGWNLAAPGLLTLGLVALLGPWATGRQVYCHQLCPHGHLQLWLGKCLKYRWTVPPKWHALLSKMPAVLLALSALSLALQWKWPLVRLEAFDAWVPRLANGISLTLAILGLALSLVLTQPYCKYGCPTGALLKWLRRKGPEDTWSKRDTAAALILLAAAVKLALL